MQSLKTTEVLPGLSCAEGFNNSLAKWRDHFLNEALCFVSNSVLVDSFVLQTPLLSQAPKRYHQP
jgi:hypothetical protein